MIFLVCVDNSDAGPKVVDRAIRHARSWEASLHVLHVFQPPLTTYALEPTFAFEMGDLEEAERQGAWQAIIPTLDESGLVWTRADRTGHPVSEIVAYAREVSPELIVIGTRGRGELASLFLGSTSRGVIQQAPFDVLVVHTAA